MSDIADDVADVARSLRAHLQRLGGNGTGQLPAPAPKIRLPVVSALDPVRTELGECTRCKLHTTRTHIVFGVGSPEAPLAFIGEAPGAEEDRRGEPFVGEAGQLLNKMIQAMGWRREDVYIANVLKCRPPGNRDPQPDEIAACEPFLKKQLAAIRPRVLVALGKFAGQWLCNKPGAPISSFRGKLHAYEGIPVMPTYHPAFLLRSPSQKRVVWEDLQLVMKELDRLGIRPG